MSLKSDWKTGIILSIPNTHLPAFEPPFQHAGDYTQSKPGDAGSGNSQPTTDRQRTTHA